MSDLAATNCGGCGCSNGGGCGSILWLIVLLSLCNGNGGSFLGNNGCGCDEGNSCIWIILLLLCCGGNGFCGC
ncbi:MAG: chorion class high-cysteine HCB protein 13 [Roseburia sp.]|nr:chorion class high-cysteine HCB protein 13 [Roseburia sp.]